MSRIAKNSRKARKLLSGSAFAASAWVIKALELVNPRSLPLREMRLPVLASHPVVGAEP